MGDLKVEDYQDGKLIKLSSALNSRARILNYIYAIFFLVSSIVFAFLGIKEWEGSVVAVIIAALAAVAFAIAFYRFINKATESEQLFINKNRLDIIYAGFFSRKVKSYNIADISGFKFSEKEKYKPHPLKGETIDYLGFQTEQQVIQELYADGRISFIYRGKVVRFGKDLVSWEANELEMLLNDITGNNFRYTDSYEQQNLSKP